MGGRAAVVVLVEGEPSTSSLPTMIMSSWSVTTLLARPFALLLSFKPALITRNGDNVTRLSLCLFLLAATAGVALLFQTHLSELVTGLPIALGRSVNQSVPIPCADFGHCCRGSTRERLLPIRGMGGEKKRMEALLVPC